MRLTADTVEKVEKTISLYSDLISKDIEGGSPGDLQDLPNKINALAELVRAANH